MKEYEKKSLEELRYEDYLARRKFKASRTKPTSLANDTNDISLVENRFKSISETIHNRMVNSSFNINTKLTTHYEKSKNEMINYLNQLQNEINYRTDVSISRLNGYRSKMIKDLEAHKRIVCERDSFCHRDDEQPDDMDETKKVFDLNDTIIKQTNHTPAAATTTTTTPTNDNNNNNLTHKNDQDASCCGDASKLRLSITPTANTDSTSSLTHITTASSVTASLIHNEMKSPIAGSVDEMLFPILGQSISFIFFLLSSAYILVWFVLINRLKVFI